jgi:predicted TIM-barrel fold metal-dependent hydrolase
VPYASHRFTKLARLPARCPKSADILASFQRFYFDTALSSSPAALPSLKSFAKNGRILFGSDFPFAPADQPEAMRGLSFHVSP